MALRWKILALLVLASSLRTASADEPRDLPPGEPELIPAQFTQPSFDPTGGTPGNLTSLSAVADPPSPLVRIQVRVPSHAAPGKDITYKIVVTNSSAADAYRVMVRNPLPPGVAQVVKAEPKPDKADPTPGSPLPKEIVWNLGTMSRGQQREIELVLRPTPETKEIRNQAFVTFEHGQAVVTKIDKAKLAVRKATSKQALQDEPIAVRVEVTNNGRVPITDVELVEDISKGLEFAPGTEGDRTNNPQQRLWKIGTMRPGERKLIDYRLVAKNTGDLLTSSVVKSPDAPEGDRAESTIKIVNAGLTLDLSGPPTAVGGESALYEVVVRNTGSLPLNTIKLTVAVPEDCKITRMTANGQRYRDQLVWTIPDKEGGPLRPGESYTVRFKMLAETGGVRTVRALAESGKIEQAREVKTNFQATAMLQWTASLDPPSLATGREGLLTVRVRNQGGDAARNVRLRVELPKEVKLVEATPRNQAGASEVIFDNLTIPANGSEEFTVTYKAAQPGQGWFVLKLAADALGDKPLVKEQAVTITAAR